MQAFDAYRNSPRMAEEASMRSFYSDWLERAGVIDKLVGVESNFNPKAQNPLSTARGLGQFIDSTWISTVAKYRPDIYSQYNVNTKRGRDALLALRDDPALAREMTKRYAEENVERLRQNGIEVTPGGVYMMHFAGPQGGVRVLTASRAAAAENFFTPKAVRVNGDIIKGKTVGQLRDWADTKMAAPLPGLTAGLQSGVPLPSSRPIQTPDQAPVPSARARAFVERYLTPGNPIQEARADQKLMRTAAGGPQNVVGNPISEAMREKGLMRDIPAYGQMPYDTRREAIAAAQEQKGNLTAAAAIAAGGRQMRSPRSMEGGPGGLLLDPAATPPPEFREAVHPAPAAPAAPGTPAAPAAPAAAAAATPPAAVEEKKGHRGGLAGQIVAGGIDLLVGGAPGVGIANTLAGVFTEGGSLGERIVDDFLSGKSRSVSDTATFKGDGSTDRQRDLLQTASWRRNDSGFGDNDDRDGPRNPAEDFEKRYLRPAGLWRQNLPKPTQKWPRPTV